jgi:hypothetical protein
MPRKMSATLSLDPEGRLRQNSVLVAARRHGPALAVLVALTIVMCRNLIFSREFPGGWDVVSITYPITYLAKTDSYFSLWEESGTGYVTPISLFHLLAFVADVLGDPALVSRAVLIFSVLAAGLFMYLYSFAVTKKILSSVAAGIVFCTSPWLAANTAGGHGFLIIAYALIPLLFLVLEKGLDRASLSRMLCLGLLVSVLPALRVDPLAYIPPFMLLFAIWWVAMAGRAWRGAATNALRLLLPAMILGAVLSAYVWLPLVRTGTAHASLHFELSQIANDTLRFWPTLKGQPLIYSYLFWLGGTSYDLHQFLPPLIYGAVLLLTPALAFAQVRLRDDRRVSFFLLAALVSVFLAKGPWAPLGEVYSWLWRYVPFVDQLHVPNRWLMLTWFAYAFLAGLTLDTVRRALTERLRTAGPRLLRGTVPAAVVVLLLVGCTVGVSYVFTDGYQTLRLPEEEVAPHRWLGENGGSGRFMVVPYDGNRAFVPAGWIQHDLGFTGGMFSGLPAFDETYFQGFAGDVFRYVGDLIRGRAETLAKILGAYDVEYVIAQGYPLSALPRYPLLYTDADPAVLKQDYGQHDYIAELNGLREVFQGPEPEYTLLAGEEYERDLTYNERGPELWPLEPERRSVVYENGYWTPRVFVPRKQMLVVGGLESLGTIAAFDEFTFQDWDVRFASRALDELGGEGLIGVLQSTDLLVLNNCELLDLAMMIGDSEVAEHDDAYIDLESLWTRGSSSLLLITGEEVLQARENRAQATLTVDLDRGLATQGYELWARVFYGPRASLIRFELDGREVGSLLPSARQDVGFVWERVGTATLEPGRHEVSVTALDMTGSFDTRLDEVALVRVGAVDEAMELLGSIIEETQVDVVSLQRESRLWRPSGSSTQLSRFDQWEIPLAHPEDAGVKRALYGGEADAPQFLNGRRFLVREGKPAAGYTPLLQLEFEEPQDWRHSTYLILDFKGLGSGEEVRVRITFGDDSGRAVYSFEDLSSKWQSVRIPLCDPATTEGSARWDQVSSLTVGMGGADVQEGVGLGTITVMEDRLSLESLGTGLGVRTFVLSSQRPAPATVAELLSAPGDAPGEILRLEQASPWLYHLRVAATAPYTLVFSNTYHPLWHALVDEQEISPQPSYYSANAYTIDKIGEYDLTLEFVGQRYQRSGFAVSALAYGASFAALAGCLLKRWRGNRPPRSQDAETEAGHGW